MDRRAFSRSLGLGLAAGLVAAPGTSRGAEATAGAGTGTGATTAPAGSGTAGTAAATATPGAAATPAPFHFGMIIFDGMTNLDFAAPQDAFTKLRGGQVHVLAKTRDAVKTDTGGRVLPDLALAEAPELDLLFIGGGPGVNALMEDAEMLGFLAARAPHARWITSVCTGALVLGAAGLLRGYKAATHWTAMDVLPLLGAEPVHERVVIDRNRITGGGVTAGLDFGLAVLAKLGGDDLARLVQLGQEYDPAPPFDSGSPRKAPAAIVERFRNATARTTAERMAAARRVAAKFG
jgi:cyclohexyl-isocyanide hydratase